MPRDAASAWLLLIHQLPAKPAYARVKVWRRLQALGAVTVKGAVYALPANAETQEDFAWLAKEIVEDGGEAMICEAALVEGLSDHDTRRHETKDAEAQRKSAKTQDSHINSPPLCTARRRESPAWKVRPRGQGETPTEIVEQIVRNPR